MKTNVYIGEFPPPFGGVSTKNEFLVQQVYNRKNITIVNLYDYKRNPLKLFCFIRIIYKVKKNNSNIYLGIGSQKRLRCLLQILRVIGGKTLLKRTSIYVMGCTLKEYCEKDNQMFRLVSGVRRLYVELQSMINELYEIGITNTYLLPNCRDGANAVLPHKLDHSKPISLLFFSTVNREKGVPFLFEMARILNKKGIAFKLDIYGQISMDYRDEFKIMISQTENCEYKGVFDTTKENLYLEMNKYDLILLPTKWKGESCIGVLVESKMSGIPAIVSNHKYNSEIVLSGKEGFVIDGDLGTEFANIVEKISKEDGLYETLAEGAYLSRNRYDIRAYKEILVQHSVL